MTTQQEANLACELCGKSFLHKNYLNNHKRIQHVEKQTNLACEPCGKTFSHKYYLKNHNRIEHVENPSAGECDQCGERFKNQHQLKRHKYQRHDLKKKVKCDNCEKMFPNIFSKEIHNKRIHLREKNFSCKKCYYRGFDVNDLKYHTMNKHSNEKPHKCATCPMAFKRVSGLYQHSKTHANAHSDAKDFQCEICGKKFRLKSSSDRCVAKHNGHGTFPCPVEGCGGIFENLFTYKSHVRRIHFSKNNIYPCHQCDKSFKTNSDLKRHSFYIHEGRKKIIPCPKCPKKWKSEKTMKRHMMSHETGLFKCPFEGCTVVRKMKYSLNHHFKLTHGKVKHKLSLGERLAREKEQMAMVPCKICGVLIKSGKCPRYNMELHMKSHNKNAPLSCPVDNCPEKIYHIKNRNQNSFSPPGLLFQHLDKVHNINMISHVLSVAFKCKLCDENQLVESLGPERFERGKFWHRNSQVWSEILRKHILSGHKLTSLNIETFKQEWKSFYENGIISIKVRSLDHRKELDKVLGNKCKLCSFEAKKQIRKDKGTRNRVGEKRSLIQHYCFNHFSEPMEYFVEEFISGKKCLKCDKEYAFPSNTKKLMHVGYVHAQLYVFLKEDTSIDLSEYTKTRDTSVKKPNKYPCNICGTVFKKKAGLKNHLVYHSDDRPFSCSICNKAFKTQNDVKKHTVTHSGEKRHKCEICTKDFSQDGNLKKHTESQHSRREVACNVCGQTFLSNYDHTIHIAVHNSSKPFQCDQCRRGFSNPRDLSRHIMTHTGERPFPCNVCQKSFTLESNLKKHLLSQHHSSSNEGSETQI